MSKFGLSLIITTYNEEKNIEVLLNSIKTQTLIPDETIIVDSYSEDETSVLIKNFISKNKNLNIKLICKSGNRSVGRNKAIESAKSQIILITDSGCVLDKDWVRNISKPFRDPSIEVVSGYYDGLANTVFEKCIVPYVLVMPDKTSKEFLPATRSMAIRKKTWKEVGKFAETYSHNEDFVFAKILEKKNKKIYFEKKAIAHWIPISTYSQAYRMFYRFSFGDAEAKIFRSKVLLIYIRYVFVILLFLLYLYGYVIAGYLIITLTVIYLFWAIIKNYKYVNDLRAFFFLPSIQVVSDLSIMIGTARGMVTNKNHKLI